MPNQSGGKTVDEMIVSRKDLMKNFFLDNSELVRTWEKLREDYEVAMFKKKYRAKQDPWADDTQLTLFP
jgi:hypothetical protein